MNFTAIDAFSGAGGLTLGLIRAGFAVKLAFDNDVNAIETHKLNIDGRAEVLDASSTSGAELLNAAGLEVGELDLLAGGPPCQGFSLQRRGPRDDKRNNLVLRYLDWLEEMQPRAFLLENVPAIRGVRGSEFIQAVEDFARAQGYAVHARILNAAHFGVPQQRRRAILVGLPKDALFEWPEPDEGGIRTVRQTIGHLPPPPPDGSEHPSYPNHRQDLLSPINLERIKHVPEGGGRLDLPDHLWLNCHRGNHRHLDTYGRLAWDKPAGTITARFDSFTRGRFGHPDQDRSITLREGASLQSFPEDFTFVGTKVDVARYVGNAVPPLLAECIGRSIFKALSGDIRPGNEF